jgi:hypothetical protein
MSIIAAGTTTTTALSSTGNTDGTLQFQVNGTTASVTLNTLGAIGVGSSPSYGTSGQVLTSGGSTTAPTWTTATSSQWTTSGSNIFYNTGPVGFVGNPLGGNGGVFRSIEIGSSGTNTTNLFTQSNAAAGGITVGGYITSSNTSLNNAYSGQQPTRLYMNDGAFQFFNAAAGATGSTISFTEQMRLNKTGALVLAGGTTTANGVGITFPATQSASTNANTLDDYEEGTWTPTVFGSTTAGTGTYGYQEGLYVKVGQMVMATAFISMNTNSGTGNIRFGGLPFALSNIGTNRQSAAIGYFNNCSLTASNIPLSQGDNGQIYLHLYQTPVGGGAANPVPMDTSFEISFTITYRCDA